MKFCKDCKHSALNTERWSTKEYQQMYLVCTISRLDPVNGRAECSQERLRALFSDRCGPSARHFQASDEVEHNDAKKA